MATTTLQAIREYMIDHYGLGRRGTNTGTSQTAITDDGDFGGHSAQEGIGPGCYVRITSGTAAPDEEVTRLSGAPVRTSGVMQLDPGLTAVLANSDTFEILYKPFSYTDRHGLHPAIVQAQKVIPEKLLVPFSLVTDGDMLASGVTSWGSVGNSATAVKAAASFPFGLRELVVTNHGVTTDGYLPSAAIPVDSSASYYLEATVHVTNVVADITARLICYDLTNSTALDVENDDTTQQEPEVLSSVVQTGSSTERVGIRIGGDEVDTVSRWSNVIFMKQGQSEFLVQDRAEVDRLGKLFVATSNTWGNRGLVEIGGEPEQLTEGLWQYRAASPVSGRSVWYEEFRKAAALSADADTTGAPVEHVAAVAAELLLRPLKREEKWYGAWEEAAKDSAAVRGKYAQQRTYVNRASKYHPLPVV